MSTFEHWAHRLYPKLAFDDCLEKIESLGHKREIQVKFLEVDFLFKIEAFDLLLVVVVVVVGYPTPYEGWGHGGRPWTPRS